MFLQAFGTPKNHPKSKPFIDRTMGFYVLDGRIWIRNYQVKQTAQLPPRLSEYTNATTPS